MKTYQILPPSLTYFCFNHIPRLALRHKSLAVSAQDNLLRNLQWRLETGRGEEYNQLNLNWFITFKLKSISDGQTDDSDIITTRSQWDILILIDNDDITY